MFAMLVMVNAAPVQNDKKNLQNLMDVLANIKPNAESNVQEAINLASQQQYEDDGSLKGLQALL